MVLLLVVHIGETLGHLARALAVADALTRRGATVHIASSNKAKATLNGHPNKYTHHAIEWRWSHNSSGAKSPTHRFLHGIRESNLQLLDVCRETRPDWIVGFPGVFSAQAARKVNIPHVSVLHGPYLSPLLELDRPTFVEKAIVRFTSSLFRSSWDAAFAYLSKELAFPALTYEQYVRDELIVAPQPNLNLKGPNHITSTSFVSASIGPAAAASENLEETCYVSFGSGNPCDIRNIVEAAAREFARVIVSTGLRTPQTWDRSLNVESMPFVSSASLLRRVGAVISHGGIGTVGTFAAAATPQLIIPTEVDQATMAMHARRQRLALTLGMHEWAMRPQLGRRLPALDPDRIRRRISTLRDGSYSFPTARATGADEIAGLLMGDRLHGLVETTASSAALLQV
jgi:UDP:flavonoid glycosyltransferase YjiC (YdhE family)